MASTLAWHFFVGRFYNPFCPARVNGLASLPLFGQYPGAVDALRLSPLRFDVLESYWVYPEIRVDKEPATHPPTT